MARHHRAQGPPKVNGGVVLVCGKDLIHVLECGADRWNVFRDRNPGAVMLNRASLAHAQLANADLRLAFLLDSDLQCTNLMHACLERAILRKTNFHGSDLRFARLDGADLFAADLSGADLRGASLVATFLRRANLRGADLSTARGLTHDQIAEAFGDPETRLPDDVAPPDSWARKGCRE